MKRWVNSEYQGAAIFAKAATGARISFTFSKKPMFRKSSGISRFAIICVRILKRQTNTAR